ncbi:MAG: hypothetical protein Q7S37_01440 [bacterium]|nr:hypothetical protein [bacterium]
MVYALKTQRLTTRKPPKDQFLTCQIHPSSEEKEGYAGCLFSLIEISSDQYSNAQIGQSIINTTAREYFRLTDDNASANFEQALRKTNEVLANYTQDGQTDWIGNLNGVIALIYKDEMHIASVGKTISLLIREGKTSNITPDTANGEEGIHPLCTFSNITSGALEKNDLIALANQKIFSHTTKQELKQLLEINSLEDASINLARILSQPNPVDTNLILIETTTKEDIANEPLSNVPDTIYLDETNQSLPRKAGNLLKKKVIPTSLIILTATTKTIRSFFAWSKKEISAKSPAILSLSQLAIKKLKHLPLVNKIPNLKDENNTAPHPVKVHHYNRFPKINLSKLPIYPIIIGCLIIILVTSIILEIKHTAKPQVNPNTTKNTTLTNLQTKYNLTKSASDKEAISMLEEIISQLSDRKLTSQEKELLNNSKSKYQLLTKSTEIDLPANKIQLPPKTLKVSILGNNTYAFTQIGSIFKKASNESRFKSTSKLPSNSGNIVAVAGPTSNQSYIILTAEQKMFESLPNKAQVNTINSNEIWKSATAIATFSNNLYLLSPKNSQIWKYTPSNQEGRYNSAVPYLTSKDTSILSEMTDITIDSSIYTLSKSGKIYRIQKTNLTELTYSKFPSPTLVPQHPSILYTTPQNDFFFLVEQNKIIVTDKKGEYIKQIKINTKQIKDIFVQPILRKIWIATDNYLFSTTY